MESIPEIDRIQKVAARLGKVAPVSLRVNPDVDVYNMYDLEPVGVMPM